MAPPESEASRPREALQESRLKWREETGIAMAGGKKILHKILFCNAKRNINRNRVNEAEFAARAGRPRLPAPPLSAAYRRAG
jgi:hypothetical protein